MPPETAPHAEAAARPLAPPEVLDAEGFARATGASPAAVAEVERYRTLLEAGSARMNLVGPSALQEFWPRHAWDSAQLLPWLGDARTVADVGAGAGFPGVVLAILLKGRAGGHVHLVESLGKRCRFLQDVVDALALPATVHNARAEALDSPPEVEVVTARACAPLPRLLDFTWPWLRTGARGLFLKGRTASEEIAEARRSWRLELRTAPSLSDPSGTLLLVDRAARVRT